jgi:hypothetical protein
MLWSNLSLPLANKTDFPGEHPDPPLNRMQRARSSDGLMKQLWYQLGKALSQP